MCAPAARNSSCLLVDKQDTVLVVCYSKSLEWDVEKLQTAEIFVQFFDVLESSSRPGIVWMEGIRDHDFTLEELVPFEVERTKSSQLIFRSALSLSNSSGLESITLELLDKFWGVENVVGVDTFVDTDRN